MKEAYFSSPSIDIQARKLLDSAGALRNRHEVFHKATLLNLSMNLLFMYWWIKLRRRLSVDLTRI
jgi:hypothetical protein